MEGSITLKQWATVALSALAILALGYIGSQLFFLALAAAPLVIGVAWNATRKTPRKLSWTILGGLCVLMTTVATPLAGYFFSAAILTGLALPALFSRRLGEDDCYCLIPVIFAVAFAGLLLADQAVRPQSAWRELQQLHARSIASARQMQDSHFMRGLLPEEKVASWQEASRLMPYRVTGLGAAAAGMLFYFGIIGFRRGLPGPRRARSGFIYFRLKETYITILIAALGAWSAWIAWREPWMGHMAYGLLFFLGAALFIESISLAVFYAAGAERPGLGLLFGAAAAALMALAPVLAVLSAAVGLADVWLDFRKLDRTIGGVSQ